MSKNSCIKRINKVYKGMRERCNNPNHIGYHLYGGRGIQVIISRIDFIEWYLERVTDEMVRPNVDRINNDGHYEISNIQLIPARQNAHKMLKENGAWETKFDNMKRANEKRSINVTIDGTEYASKKEAARETGLDVRSIGRAMKKHKTSNLKTIKKKVRTFIEAA